MDTIEYTPIFTGVPPHVLLMSQMELLRRKIDDIQKGINSDMNKMIDKRGVVVNEFRNNVILSAIEESKNNIVSVVNNVTKSNINEDVLLKHK